jgi:type II secretory pathway pseudopilin PulG
VERYRSDRGSSLAGTGGGQDLTDDGDEFGVVIVFLGLLAAIALNRYPAAIEWTRNGAVKNDLRHALQVEEEVFANSQEYIAFSVGPGGSVANPPFQASVGVSVTVTVSGGTLMIVGQHMGSPTVWCISTHSDGFVEAAVC